MSTRKKQKARSKSGGTNSNSNKRSRKDVDLPWGVNEDDAEIESSSEDEEKKEEVDESSSEEENLDVKKVRLAREYLAKIDAKDDDTTSDEESADESDEDKGDIISRKLQKERLKLQGTLERNYADKVTETVDDIQKHILAKRPALLSIEESAKTWIDAGYVNLLSGHDLTPTCVALQYSSDKAISGAKDHTVILWDIEKQCKITYLCQHWKKNNANSDRTKGQVLSVACSDDGRYAAVGKKDASVSLFDIRSNDLVKTFYGHKGPVSCLTFRSQTLQLFSGSDDRCIRHYNIDEMMYIETLYGHQSAVSGIDCYRKERPISIGRDRTARAWKLAEDSHLIFRGGAKVQAADTITVIKDDWFITGHEDGNISLWLTDKKRAVTSIERAHNNSSNDGIANPIVSVNSIKGSDIVASGSSDGYLRFWKVQTGRRPDERGIDAICQIPVHGFINGIAFDHKARFCVTAIGQEHRNGRWTRIPRAKNRFAIIKLQHTAQEKYDEDNNDTDDDSTSSSNSEVAK